MDRLTKEARSLLMARVGIKNTDIEKLLAKIVAPLWKQERYRKNVRNLPGRPDIVFPKSKIAIFADGDFWHGKDFEGWRRGVPEFWEKKIDSNIARDKRQVIELRKRGYRVLRFWGSSIKKHPERIGARINRYFDSRKAQR